MKLSPEQKLAMGFGLALALLLTIAALAYFNTSGLLDNNSRVTHSYQMLGQLELTLSLLKDAETGQRGYLITGDHQYLQPYNDALSQVDGSLQQIGVLIGDDPHRQEELARLKNAVGDKLAELKDTIAVYDARGPEAARRLVTTNEGKARMDNIRSMVSTMQAEERSLLEQHSTTAEDSARNTVLLFLLLALLDFALLALVYFITRHDMAESRRADRAVRVLNVELEQRVAERTAELETANRTLEHEVVVRKRAEEESLQLAGKLQDAVKELEAFSYSVAHDLRAPLRAITGFANAVLEDYGPTLDDTGQEYLHTITQNAQNMGQLIDDLLAFSRLSRQEMARTDINMSQLATEVFDEVMATAPDPNRGITFTVGTLPRAMGDRTMIRQVFANLLANAEKFTRNKEPAIIEVGAGSDDTENIYFVRDNGAGFDMKYYNKLFIVFQQLHRPEEYEGTGIGLALVQRIVKRHGGRVWAEGKVNEGATFYFALPKGGTGG